MSSNGKKCIYNDKTNRCVDESGRIGKELLKKYTKDEKRTNRKKCQLNKDGNCSVKKEEEKKCIFNDKTNRCVDESGKVGKDLIKRYSPSELIKNRKKCTEKNGKCFSTEKKEKKSSKSPKSPKKSKSSRPPSPSLKLSSKKSKSSRPRTPTGSSEYRKKSSYKMERSFEPQSRNCIERSKIPPLPHQVKVVEWLNDNRGIIAVHKVGSGKTLTAVVASQCFLDKNPNDDVIVISPKTLIANFKKEMIQYGVSPDDNRYKFYSFESFLNRKISPKSTCKNNFLIVDEAHTLRTELPTEKQMRKKEETRKYLGKKLYTKSSKIIQCAKQAKKVLLLTATPFVNTSYDLANLVAMVKGTNPMSRNEWEVMWNKSDEPYFQNLFSVYGGQSVDYPETKIEEVFLEMTPEFYKKYSELENKKKDQAMDFLLTGNPYSFLTGFRTGLLKIEDSAKIRYAVEKITETINGKNGEKIVIYSNFIESGIRKIEKFLKDNNIKYSLITGSMDSKKRKQSVDDYNSGKIRVLLISKAGGVGIDLKETTNMVILDVPWNKTTLDQAVGRVSRYRSHVNLPKERQKVHVYILYTRKPKDVQPLIEQKKILPSVDILLYDIIMNKMMAEVYTMEKIIKYSI